MKMTLQEIMARRAQINQRKAAIADIARRAANGEEVTDDLNALTSEVDALDAELRSLAANELAIRSSAQFEPVTQPQTTQQANASRTAYDSPRERAMKVLEGNEYKRALMEFMQRGTPIPMQYRESLAEITTITDASAAIPATWFNEIVKKTETYGTLVSKCRLLNVRGGVKIPIASLKPTATWITETSPSNTQKLTVNSAVEFSYHTLEVKLSQTILVNVTTLEAFQALFIELAAEAMAKALDKAIVSGSGDGQPKGITVDTRVPAENIITLSATEFNSWKMWKKKVFAKMKKSYQDGTFYMAQGTYDGYIDGMTDEVGQPIGRVNYGTSDGPAYRFGGKPVETVEDEIINNYDAASVGDVVAIFAKMSDYAINSNMQMTVTRWIDHDGNEIKNKAMLIADGKLLDANGVIIIKKG